MLLPLAARSTLAESMSIVLNTVSYLYCKYIEKSYKFQSTNAPTNLPNGYQSKTIAKAVSSYSSWTVVKELEKMN